MMAYPGKSWKQCTEGYPLRRWLTNDTHFHKLVLQESLFEFDYQLLGYVEERMGAWVVMKYHPGPLLSKQIGRYATLDEAKAVLLATCVLEET